MILSIIKMVVATLSSRILGLVREQVMAAYFGASGITDAFVVAYRIPNMLRDLFAEGAFSSALVPVFTEAYKENPNKARELLWSLFIILLIATGIISILIILNAETIVSLLTSNKFILDKKKFELTILMVKIIAPFLSFISISALFMGVLNTLKVFFLPSFAPVFFNLSMILSMIFLPSLLISKGLNIALSLALGALVGGALQCLVQLPLIIKKGMGFIKPTVYFSNYTSKILQRMGIGTIGVAATQINLVVTTILATGTQVGAVSWLTYSFRLFQFPVGIFGVSIAGSNLIHFSDALKSGKIQEARDIFKRSYYFVLFILLPSTLFILCFSQECVQIVFQRGAFDVNSSIHTANALRLYAIGLPAYGLYKLIGPVFFAIDRAKIPVFISIFGIILNIIFCTILTPLYGYKILSLGVSLSIIVNVFLEICFLKKDLDLNLSIFINYKIIKLFLSLVLTFLVLYYTTTVASSGFYNLAIFLFIALIKTSFFYLFFLLCLGEWRDMINIYHHFKK